MLRCLLLHHAFGAAIGQSALYSGFLESYGYDIAFTPLDFFKGRWPFLLIVPAWAFTMGYKIAPEKPITDVASVVVSGKTKQKLNKFADIAGVVIFLVLLCFAVSVIRSALRLG